MGGDDGVLRIGGDTGENTRRECVGTKGKKGKKGIKGANEKEMWKQCEK